MMGLTRAFDATILTSLDSETDYDAHYCTSTHPRWACNAPRGSTSTPNTWDGITQDSICLGCCILAHLYYDLGWFFF